MCANGGQFGGAVDRSQLTWMKDPVCRLAAVFELDPESQMIDELIRTDRIELWWGGSNIKWIERRDRVTGVRASGKSYESWNIALGQAVHKMLRLLPELADERP